MEVMLRMPVWAVDAEIAPHKIKLKNVNVIVLQFMLEDGALFIYSSGENWVLLLKRYKRSLKICGVHFYLIHAIVRIFLLEYCQMIVG